MAAALGWIAVVFVAVLAPLPQTVTSQIPSVCADDSSLTNKECCPNSCGGEERGTCEDIELPDTYSDISSDVRSNWPHYFTRACACKENYAGVDCTRCKYGYRGDDCMTKVSEPRRDLLDLTNDEWTKYHDALKMARRDSSGYKIVLEEAPPGTSNLACEDISLYSLFIWLHHYAAKDSECEEGDSCSKVDYAHEATGFPTWHRQYLLWLEWEIQYMLKASGDSEYYKFRTYYWDWRKDTRADIFTTKRMGERFRNANGQPGVEGDLFSEGWDTICWYNASGGVNIVKGTICNSTINTGPLLRCPFVDGDINSELGPCRSDNDDWPTMDIYDRAISKEDYDTPEFNRMTSDSSFRNFMEGFESVDDCNGNQLCTTNPDGSGIQRHLHNTVHIVAGIGHFETNLPGNMKGVMADTAASPNDPIFINHHAMVDCVLEEWLQRNEGAEYPADVPDSLRGHQGDNYIVPFFPLYTHNDMLKTADSFGYSCDLDGTTRGAGTSWILQGPASSTWVLPAAAILWNLFLAL